MKLFKKIETTAVGAFEKNPYTGKSREQKRRAAKFIWSKYCKSLGYRKASDCMSLSQLVRVLDKAVK